MKFILHHKFNRITQKIKLNYNYLNKKKSC